MTRKKQLYLICYDIADDKNRRNLAALLIRQGYERIQESVFIGVHHPVKIKTLWIELKIFISDDDRLMVIKIAKKAFLKMKILGSFPFDKKYLAGDIHTLFID